MYGWYLLFLGKGWEAVREHELLAFAMRWLGNLIGSVSKSTLNPKNQAQPCRAKHRVNIYLVKERMDEWTDVDGQEYGWVVDFLLYGVRMKYIYKWGGDA